MRILWRLMLLGIGVAAFMLARSRPAAQPAPRRAPPPPRKRRIPPELTAAAAAERWYDEV
jgi:hypothetical protein